jgi:hypothetical protein
MGFGSLDPRTTATAAVGSFLLVYCISSDVWAAALASGVCIGASKASPGERAHSPIYKLAALGVASAYLAYTSKSAVASHLLWIGINLRAQPPKAPSELVLNCLLQASWVVWHGFLLAVPTGVPCALGVAALCPVPLTFLRYLGPVLHLSTLFTLPLATSGGPEHWSTKYCIPLLWDPPLLGCLWVCHCFGDRMARDGSGAATFLSIIDENICISSLPFASDVSLMRKANVKSVVNMCWEYTGPQDAYSKAGILQGRFPTFDTICPTEKSISEAVSFIRVSTLPHAHSLRSG